MCLITMFADLKPTSIKLRTRRKMEIFHLISETYLHNRSGKRLGSRTENNGIDIQ